MLADLCLCWKRNGLSPEIFILRDGDPTYRTRLEDAGIPVTASPRSSLLSPMHAQDLSKIISGKQFDLLHVHLFPAQLWAAMALRLTPDAPPAITTEHNTWNRRRDHSWCRPIDRWTYSMFRMTVCIGDSTKESLEAWLSPAVYPMCVVANGIDIARFQRDATPAPLPDAAQGHPIILCVGSLTDRKDQETLVRAVAEVDSVHVLLAGDGPLRHRIEQLAQELHVDKRVHFLGIRHDVPELIASASLYVQPSRVDGFCIAALEAMAGGLTVIASDIPGLRDLVGNCGILFSAGDYRQLAGCIRRLLLDSGLSMQLSQRGLNRARQFSIDKTAAEYQSIFEATVSKEYA
jgi:glycosyltransferase involved in cell wall biosynthesis